ncbi:hypothetical protein [Sphingomonas sp.]|uniref:hypothetical protein n=1 Tax=Sphingomonas sp. TaxID=28214 RepID=UPI0025F1203A|nr:hypothetical protein [Sphingomonas sp.]MBV9528151.1 hypothetical protein [Sphingomonas sp.]
MTATPLITPSPQPVLLDRFRAVLSRDSAAAALSPLTRLGADSIRRDELFYVPFEHMNLEARLVIVGITPGPNQIALAYDAVQAGLNSGLEDESILARAKEAGSFGGPQMRPKLLKMLQAFGFPQLLGIRDAAELWESKSALLHATSVVPHAAIRNGKPFAGSFNDVLESSVMKASFERDFAATLPLLSSDALYVALGPTPLGALDWCAARGLLRREQVMGAFAHPSNNGGSQVAIYLGEKSPGDLHHKDPVRHRVEWLLAAAARMRQSVADQRAMA